MRRRRLRGREALREAAERIVREIVRRAAAVRRIEPGGQLTELQAAEGSEQLMTSLDELVDWEAR